MLQSVSGSLCHSTHRAMPIVLHKHVPERNQHRFYTLSIEPNLFGAWSLMRRWGRIGASGRQRTDWHESQEEAEQAMQRKLREKQRRGYAIDHCMSR